MQGKGLMFDSAKNKLKSLPYEHRRWTTFGTLFVVLFTLPVMVYGLLTGQFEIRKRAATGEITPTPTPTSGPDFFACNSDTDCACGTNEVTNQCAVANKGYIDTSRQCPDFCSGIDGKLTIKCLSGTCQQTSVVLNPNQPQINISYPSESQSIMMNSGQTFCVVDIPTGGDFSGLMRRQNINNSGWTDYQTMTTLCYSPPNGQNTLQLQYKNRHGDQSSVYTRQFSFNRIQDMTVSLSGKLYQDTNCNGTQDAGEGPVDTQTTINIFKKPEFYILSTVTNDSSGNFSYSKTITEADSLSIQPLPVSPSGYTGNPHYNEPVITLDKNNRHVSISMPQVPNVNHSACFTPTSTPPFDVPKANLNFKIKLQGISMQRPNKLVTVILKQNKQEKGEFPGVEVVSDADGVYTGDIMNILPGTYDILIKGQVSLQRKFQGIVLQTGKNIQNFSQTELLTGDINNDNRINAQDLALLTKDYQPHTPPNSPADLDSDGFVNAQDIRFVIENYRKEGDE